MELLDYRKNIIVPRVERGASLHECDMLLLRPTMYATEFEIKISKSDLAKDKYKDHHHASDKIKYMFYAVPMDLVSITLSSIDKSIGVIGVARKGDMSLEAKIIRESETRPARKWTEAEQFQLARLGAMRLCSLKKENVKLLRERGR